jgi:pyruvate dehydrogenase E1 component beta subunit
MQQALDDCPQVVIMGQGVDDHKGIFGSTLGLAEEFGKHRVLDMPLSEEGMTGMAVGAALNGLYPIQTHIRVDFVLLAMNQIVNLAAKYKYMFGGKFQVPMLIRLVIGRSWGQGAQHSQSLQSLFAHIPGLTVIMPSSSETILETYPSIIGKYQGPVISLEHRLLYDLDFRVPDKRPADPCGPLGSRIARSGTDLTIVATSIMVLEALRASEYLARESNIDCEVIDLHSPSHPNWDLILHSVKKTGKLLVADTSWPAYGVCAEVCRVVAERGWGSLTAPPVTIGMQPASCPTAKRLEDWFYPSIRDLVNQVALLVTRKREHGVPLPDEFSMVDLYKRFKGPF